MFRKTNLIRILIVCGVLMAMSIATTAQQNTRQIIVLKDGVQANGNNVSAIASNYGLSVSYQYRNVLNGFAANVPAGRLNALMRDARVAYVEEDLLMSITAQTIPTGIDRSFTTNNPSVQIDGSDERVDVDVAVIDTGVDFEHPDLNVVGGTDCTLASGGGPFATRYCGGPGEGTGGDDDHYHGTHVGGTIGALDNGIGVVGVAPGARLWAVKVLDSGGSGYTSGIIAGIDWVVAQGDIEVANMSLGGSGISTAYQTAIDNAVANGVVMVVAAGNSNADANNYSPAYVPSAITVSALADFNGLAGGGASPTCRTDIDDTLADFSNWGSAVDIAAPGVCILSTYPIEQGEYASISGTSMAAPHVAGAAAILASGNNAPVDGADVTAIRNTLVNTGNFNWVDDSGDGILEPLLDLSNSTIFNASLVGGDTGGSNTPPTASFSFSCTDLSCDFDASGSSDTDGTISGYLWEFETNQFAYNVTESYIFGADGTYSVSLTVSDDDGDNDTVVQDVTVSTSGGGDATSISVSDLDGAANSSGPSWSSTVVVTVRDDSGALASGVVVDGTFSVGGAVSCTTDAAGSCAVDSASIRKRDAGSMTFSVTGLSGALAYDSTGNSDPDGDSDGTTITIFR